MTSQVTRVRGVRRLRNAGPFLPWDLPSVRRYEILLADGTRRLANLRQVDSLLDVRAYPADFWSTIQEVESGGVNLNWPRRDGLVWPQSAEPSGNGALAKFADEFDSSGGCRPVVDVGEVVGCFVVDDCVSG
jgi:hypothetical protein